MLDEDIEIGRLTQEFRDFFAQRERQDIQRLNGVVDYAEDEDCRVGMMLDYFGESMGGQCGQCDVCRGTHIAGGLPEGFYEEMTSEEIHAVHDLVAELNGSISAEHGLGRLRREEVKRYKSAVELDLMQKVKIALDPDNIMNPGKVL